MAATDKDTIYIDIDDEITGIIDKLRNSEGKVVCLVLPKRAAVFQSIVNMKLLKRAADASKKNMVLITSEAGLLPLAGAAGVHVAKTLTSKPEIPLGPQAFEDVEETIQEEDGAPVDTPLDASQSVGKLATKPPIDDGVETLMLDDEDLPPEATAAATPKPKTFDPPTGKPDKKKKDKKLHVPNFERFRLLLILFVLLLIILIGGFLYANYSLAKATITVQTNATNINANLDLNLSTSATTLNASDDIVPAKLASQQKTYSQQVPTTGQKNNGNKASGSITLSLTDCNQSTITIPAGSGVSANNQTYITQSDVTLSSVQVGKQCNPKNFSNIWSQTVDIIAQSAGSSFNVSGVPFTVAGYSDVEGNGSTSGGTDQIVQSVNQNDINSAKSKISASNDATEKQALQSQLQQDGYYAIVGTYQSGTPTVTSSANVGDVANNVTVTETVTYSMFGAHQSDLNSLLNSTIDSQINTNKQSILDNGLSNGTFNVSNLTSTTAQVSLSTKAVAGPDINTSGIKQQAEGQRSGDIKSNLESDPDVTGVTVNLSPFWVSTVPKNPQHITVVIAKPTSTASSSQNGSNP
jgi:hypothetical protein